MKGRAVWVPALSLLIATGAAAQDTAVVGQAVAKEFKLKDAMKDDDATVNLADFKGKSEVVLVWISEKCDITWRYEGRTGKLQEEFGKKGVKFFAVWGSSADSKEGIRGYAKSKNYGMPILDDANGELTRYFKVSVTPTYVIIDKEGKLRYRGACDDLQCSPASYRKEDSEAKERYVASALSAILDGKEVAVTEKRGAG
jgi:peroxiredoxin